MNPNDCTLFNHTFQTTQLWLNDLQDQLGWDDRPRTYHALRAVLHALRDRLPVDEVAAFAAQLPLLIRGCFYEGWHPGDKPLKERNKTEFLDHIAEAFRGDLTIDPEDVVRAVFQVLAKHMTYGEIAKVVGKLPAALRKLWDPATQTVWT